MKKKLLILTALCSTVLIMAACTPPQAAGYNDNDSTAYTSTSELPMITYTETFSQTNEWYFVYFWQPDCPFCAQFEPYLVAGYVYGLPIYVVNMAENAGAWHDGESHDLTHRHLIGQMVDGEIEPYFGHSLDNFPEEEGWEVAPDADGGVWARLAFGSENIGITDYTDISIQGTPTLFLIRDGVVTHHGFGVEPAIALLESMK